VPVCEPELVADTLRVPDKLLVPECVAELLLVAVGVIVVLLELVVEPVLDALPVPVSVVEELSDPVVVGELELERLKDEVTVTVAVLVTLVEKLAAAVREPDTVLTEKYLTAPPHSVKYRSPVGDKYRLDCPQRRVDTAGVPSAL
jgi:hypothetical protein